MSGLGPNLVFPSSGLDGGDVLVKSQKDRKSCWYSNVINHPFLMVNIPPIKMVIRGMVYSCYTHITQHFPPSFSLKRDNSDKALGVEKAM